MRPPSWYQPFALPWALPRPARRIGEPPVPPGNSVVAVGTITATQIANAAADRPLVLAASAIEKASVDQLFRAQWLPSGSFATGGDVSAYPTYRVYDRKLHELTSPSAAATQHYLCFDFGVTVQTIDAALLGVHNFALLGGATVKFEVADSQDFATNLRTLVTWSPGTSTKRLVSLSLNGNQASLSNVRYARLNIALPAAGVPQVGEILLSTREQFGEGALLPYDSDGARSSVSDFDAKSGVKYRYVRYSGQQALGGVLLSSGSADWAAITGTWNDSVFGTMPFAWIERPNSAPSVAYWMWADKPEFSFPYSTDQVRRWTFSMVEQAPFYASET